MKQSQQAQTRYTLMKQKTNTRVRGFFTRSRDAIASRQRILSTLLSTYDTYGFEQMETPSLESLDLLSGNLPDTDRPNGGLITADLGEDPAALRYDLTAPLSRYCAEQGDALPKPFLRSAAGMVWRNEKPSPGRSREFWQCDADVVGASLSVFPSMLSMVAQGLKSLKTPAFTFKINDRRLLDALMKAAGVKPEQYTAVLRTLDKFDKVGEEGVQSLLEKGLKDESGTFIQGLDLPPQQVSFILNLLQKEQPWIEVADALDQELADEWRTYISLLDSFELDYELDITIARGLSYYTGPVFEIILNDAKTTQKAGGAIGAGGAYDLNKKNGGQTLPAFGVSVGVDRLSQVLPPPKPPKPLLIVMSMNDDVLWEQTTAAQLRAAGWRTLAYPGRVRNFTKKLKWADKTGAAFVIFRGEDEKEQGRVQIKDLKLGKELSQSLSNEDWKRQPQQQSVPENQLLETLKKKRT